MMDEKEEIINTILMKMNLPRDENQKLKDLLWMELYPYSVIRIKETEIVVRDETFNEKTLRTFLVTKNVQGCTVRTMKLYRDTITYFANFINDKPFNEITANDIRYFLAVKKERDKVSDTTLNNYRRNLSSFFSWMHDEEYIKKNPIKKIPKIKEEKKKKQAFSEREIELLREGAVGNLRLEAIVEVLLSTGCRIAEMAGMNRRDLNSDEIVVYGKGRKERVVYMNARALHKLERYLSSRTDDNEAMFVTLDKPYDRLKISGFEIAIRKLGKKCGVENTHPHRFRRTSATMALNRGMPIEQVQQLLGHESIDTTTIYAISTQESVKANHKKYVS